MHTKHLWCTRNWAIIQIHKCAVNHGCAQVEAQLDGVDSENESRDLQQAQIIWAAVPTSWLLGLDRALFSQWRQGGGGGGVTFISWKQIKSAQRKQALVFNLRAQKQRTGVIIEWLAWWVNSPAVSSHSYAERSRLSLKRYLGSNLWNSPDWSRRRKLCLTRNRKSQQEVR